MRWSQSYIPTLREEPVEAEIASHRLMLRAGFIRKLSAGVYTYLPLGQKTLSRVVTILKEEMDRAGAQQVLLPALQPIDLWKRTGRDVVMGQEMIRFKDRHGKEMALGPTHEEVITNLVVGELRSYKQLPINLYQIQTKFRDEPRPRFGVIRSSEFIMKDGYSFDRDEKSLDQSYQAMYKAYEKIFERCGLPAIAVEAETGAMGGSDSHEFMVPAKHGEDTVVRCPCGYAASKPRAVMAEDKSKASKDKEKPMEVVKTPGVHTVEKVAQFLKAKPTQLIKTILYLADENPVAALVRGDHDVNESKLQKVLEVETLLMADPGTIQKVTGAPVGFTGPVGLKGVKTIADPAVLSVKNMVVGANQAEAHGINVNTPRDFKPDQVADIRFVVEGDKCTKCSKALELQPAIEVGHIFKLGTKYSSRLGATFLDEDGKQKPFIMGCYGIGVTRILAAVVESLNDKDGIQWPVEVAPYQVDVVPLNVQHAAPLKEAEILYDALQKAGVSVILDDRDERAGVKLKDADLIGFPYRVLVSEKSLKQGQFELKNRKTGQVDMVPKEGAVEALLQAVQA